MLPNIFLIKKELVSLEQIALIGALGAYKLLLHHVKILDALLVRARANEFVVQLFLYLVQTPEHLLDHFNLRGHHISLDTLILVALLALNQSHFVFRLVFI